MQNKLIGIIKRTRIENIHTYILRFYTPSLQISFYYHGTIYWLTKYDTSKLSEQFILLNDYFHFQQKLMGRKLFFLLHLMVKNTNLTCSEMCLPFIF